MKRACESGDTRVSIVVPVFDEEACLRELHRRLTDVVRGPLEIVFVDDGSRDRSYALIESLAAADPRVRGLGFARNRGSQHALLCGLRAARGEVICTIDADLQHPPELVPELLQAWRDGFDVVETHRRQAPPHGVVRELVTPRFYRALDALSGVRVAPASTDFRLLDRACVDQLRGWPGELVRAMVARLSATRTSIGFDVAPRFSGVSRYDGVRLWRDGAHALYASMRARFLMPNSLPVSTPARSVGVGLDGG